MINQILQDSLKIPQAENYHLSIIGWKDIEKYILESKNNNNLNKIKIIVLRNSGQFNLFYRNGNKEAKLILNKKLFKIKDSEFWANLSWHKKLTTNFAREFQDKLDWKGVCYRYDGISFHSNGLSEKFIRTFKNEVDWLNVSRYQVLSEEFIREFQNKVDWEYISRDQKLSEEFIREFQDKVDWRSVSAYQTLSEDFIREFQDKVNWVNISWKQKLSKEFRKEFAHKLK